MFIAFHVGVMSFGIMIYTKINYIMIHFNIVIVAIRAHFVTLNGICILLKLNIFKFNHILNFTLGFIFITSIFITTFQILFFIYLIDIQ